MADIFISYSRRDKEFVQRLQEALTNQGWDVYLDVDDIPAASRWRQEIAEAIEGADALVFVVSQNSLASKECRKELDHAVAHHKRVIPVACRETETPAAPEALREIHWISCREPDDFEVAVTALIKALDTDLDWVKAHTRLLTRAIEWDGKGRDRSHLLRGSDLRQAEAWLAQGAQKEPRSTDLQGAYILASRQAETRRQRWTLGIVTSGLLIAVALGLLAFYQYRVSERRRQITLSRQLAAQSSILLFRNPQTSVLLALESLRRQETAEGVKALNQGLSALPHPVKKFQLSGQARLISNFRGRGKYLATVDKDQTLRVWEVDSGRQLIRLKAPEKINALLFSPEGHWLATGRGTKTFGVLGNKIVICDMNTGRETVVLKGHKAMTWACDPGGRRLAIAWYFGSREDLGDYISQAMVQVLQPATGRELSRFLVNTKMSVPRTLNLAFSPDGKRLAVGGVSGSSKDCTTALVWDLDNQEELARMIHASPNKKEREYSIPEEIEALAFSPDGQLLATGTESTILLWQVTSGRELVRLESPVYHKALVFSPDGRFLATHYQITGPDITWAFHGPFDPQMLGSQLNVKVWDTANGQVKASLFHDEPVWTVEFSPDSRLLASMSGNLRGGTREVHLWDPNTGRVMGSWGDANLASLSFQGDGKHLVTYGWTGMIQILDINPPREMIYLNHDGPVQKLAFSPSGKLLATVEDKTVRVWEVATGQAFSRWVESGAITSLAFSPDGLWLAIGSKKLDEHSAIGQITLWQPAKNKPMAQLPLPTMVRGVAFSPNSRWLAIGCSDAKVRIWEVATRKEVLQLVHPLEQKNPFGLLAYSNDGCCLAAASSSDAFIWPHAKAPNDAQLLNEGLRINLRAHKEMITDIVFSPDDHLVATAGADNTVRLFEADSGRERVRMLHEDNVSRVAFSPDGSRLVSASRDHTARVWETVSGRELSLMKHNGPVVDVAFSPCGRFIASAEECPEHPQEKRNCRALVRLWEAATGVEVAQFPHEKGINDVAFSPDGRILASASQDGTVRLWRWRPDDLMKEACARLTRNLTKAEWQQYLPGEPYRPTCPELPAPQK